MIIKDPGLRRWWTKDYGTSRFAAGFSIGKTVHGRGPFHESSVFPNFSSNFFRNLSSYVRGVKKIRHKL